MTLNYPNYPKHIIGKSNFKKIDNVAFLKHRGFFIGRTTSLGADSFSIDVVKESFAEGKEVKDTTVKRNISQSYIYLQEE